MNETDPDAEKKSPFLEIARPFVDLAKAPRALWALNLTYLIEGFVYLGTLIYLAMFFNEYAGLGDRQAGWMVGLMTAGITLSMLFFGSRVDSWGLRRTLFLALGLMFLGRAVIGLSPFLGLAAGGLLAPMNLTAAAGILLVVLGFGCYQPAVYAGTRAVTTAATSGMAFAMLYALYNLGGWLPTFMSPLRRVFGISGALGFFAAATLLGMAGLAALLTKETLAKALRAKAGEGGAPAMPSGAATEGQGRREPGGAAASGGQAAAPDASGVQSAAPGAPEGSPPGRASGVIRWLKEHPLADPGFSFFIFSLIPIQTLFAYNWFILPQYVSRAFRGGWVGNNFETATSLNPLLVFLLCPIVAALASKTRVYSMMILGTATMALPPFFLAAGPSVPGLFAYLVVLSVGEAMWQPRFLQFAAEIAPEGRTGAYMGVAQFPWFLTKMIVPLYSGLALSRWCPMDGPLDGHGATGTMWLVFGLVALATPTLLLLGRARAGGASGPGRGEFAH
jgi:MFS family permease